MIFSVLNWSFRINNNSNGWVIDEYIDDFVVFIIN